jgi:hypothetical protein
MTLYSYVIARDYGFAPNPFHGVCTLATCKPQIRAHAQSGDWVMATGSKGSGRQGHLVYAMRVDEVPTFDKYWEDPRFRRKRPMLNGSLKQRYGDNIYHRDKKTGKWVQENSHHSLPNGDPNVRNIKRDTGTTQRVLVGTKFGYWGRSGPKVPTRLRQGTDVCCTTQGHKCKFDAGFAKSVVAWLESLELDGFMGTPMEFP